MADQTQDVQQDVQEYIDSLEQALASTDGVDYGGGAWTDLYGIKKDESGAVHQFRINITSHARTPRGALDNLMDGIGYAQETYRLNPWPTEFTPVPGVRAEQVSAPRPPAPAAPAAQQNQVATGSNERVIDITNFLHQVTPNGKHILKARNNKELSQFGVTVWEEVADDVPAAAGWREWPMNKQPITAPDGMKKAVMLVEPGGGTNGADKPLKVLRFIA